MAPRVQRANVGGTDTNESNVNPVTPGLQPQHGESMPWMALPRSTTRCKNALARTMACPKTLGPSTLSSRLLFLFVVVVCTREQLAIQRGDLWQLLQHLGARLLLVREALVNRIAN